MFWILFLLPFILACESEPIINTSATQAIIFVPGFYGSELVRQDNEEKIWVSFSEAMAGSQTLAMPYADLKLDGTTPLKAGSVLQNIRLIPGVYSYEIYGPSFSFLKKNFGSTHLVDAFAYDWREDPIKSIHELHKYLVSLKARGIKHVSLVTHSMGAMITSYYLRFGTQEPETAQENWAGLELVDKVALITAPFGGSGFIFLNLQHGRKIAFNNTLLSPKAFSSFPSSYFFLPYFQKDFLVDQNLKSISGLSSVEAWQKNGWGLFNPDIENQNDVAVVKNRMAFTRKYLARGKTFIEKLNTTSLRNPPKLIPLLSLTAESARTINRIQVLGEKGKIQDFDENNAFFVAPGDGTLTSNSQVLPKAFERLQLTRLTASTGHLEALDKKEIREQIKAWLQRDLLPSAADTYAMKPSNNTCRRRGQSLQECQTYRSH